MKVLTSGIHRSSHGLNKLDHLGTHGNYRLPQVVPSLLGRCKEHVNSKYQDKRLYLIFDISFNSKRFDRKVSFYSAINHKSNLQINYSLTLKLGS